MKRGYYIRKYHQERKLAKERQDDVGKPEDPENHEQPPKQRKRRKKQALTREELERADCKDDLVVTPIGSRNIVKTKTKDEEQVTFANTKNYGRNIEEYYDNEDPVYTKYAANQGSVKGLHYVKYIALELLSEKNFTVSFHKFYSAEIKNIIKNLEECRYDPDLRKWVLPTERYNTVMVEIKGVCELNKIHVEDIPQFTINLMKTKVPWSLSPTSYYANI